jgi:hypothetical protein
LRLNLKYSSTIAIDAPKSGDKSNILVRVSGLSNDDVSMLRSNSSDSLELDMIAGQNAQATIKAFNSLLVAPILQFAAKGGLRYSLLANSEWTTLTPSRSIPFGSCQSTIPMRPKEDWFYDMTRKSWERRSRAGESRNYFLALRAAKKPFRFCLTANCLSIEMNPDVAGHHAAHMLLDGRGVEMEKELNVSFQLSDVTQQSDPIVKAFVVHNCDNEKPTDVRLKDEVSIATPFTDQ